MFPLQVRSTVAAATVLPSLLSDEEVARILVMTLPWVRAHAGEIPGFERLGSYFRFRSSDIEEWLGSMERLLEAEQVATLLHGPISWVYANAEAIPGFIRLGRYIRFRPKLLRPFLGGEELAQ